MFFFQSGWLNQLDTVVTANHNENPISLILRVKVEMCGFAVRKEWVHIFGQVFKHIVCCFRIVEIGFLPGVADSLGTLHLP